MSDGFVIRRLEPTDSIDEMTELLHRAYAGLAAMGLRYWATHQSADITRKRIANSTCLVAVDDSGIRGTILFRDSAQTSGCPWYDQPGVASFGQFAVDPTLQKNGLGLRLLGEVETLARASGATELALDTAEPATHLVGWYTRLGYRFIEHTQWQHTNYRSVVLSKALAP
jgi:predicted N-acetyltransferase YhbS